MLFLIPDNEGRIIQANKVYDPTGYGKRLDDAGLKYLAVDHPGVLSPDAWYIPDGELTERPVMAVTIDKTTIKAGDNDAAVLTGAPKGVQCTVSAAGSVVWDVALPDGELELSIPIPVSYEVTLRKWPYRDFTVTIEALAA